ncbi:MAG: LysR family transcriptional regulator [Lacisediminihabitans sp.]
MFGPHLPDLVALQMLVTVSETGSLTAASRKLGVTQQAVSARMRSVEGQIGVPLIVRSPRGSTLTEAGMLMAGWATDVLTAANRLDAAIESLRSDADTPLKVAASLTIAEHLLPRWLVALREHQDRQNLPAIRVDLTVTNSASVIDLIRSGSHPLGFIETPEVPDDINSRLIASDELVVVVAPDHRWTRARGAITATELASTPLITRETGSGTRRALEHILAGLPQPLELKPAAAELPTTAAIRTAVAAGIAPAVLSILAVQDDITLGRIVPVRVKELRLTRALTAVWPATTSSPVGAALDLLHAARTTS